MSKTKDQYIAEFTLSRAADGNEPYVKTFEIKALINTVSDILNIRRAISEKFETLVAEELDEVYAAEPEGGHHET